MANTTTNVLPLLLAQGLMALRKANPLTRLTNNSYQGLAEQKGAIINVPIPSAIPARAVSPSVAPVTAVDFAPTSVAVTLDWWYESPFALTDKDRAECMNGIIPMQASEAIKSLSDQLDSYIIGKSVGIYGMAGTPGTTPFSGSLNMAGTARKLLNKQLAPTGDRRGVLDPDAENNFLLNTNILQADQRGDQGGVIEGSIGRKLGIDWYMNQNITAGVFTPGTAAASGYIASTNSGAIGQSTLNVLNATATGLLNIGDIFTLVADTQAQQYVITAVATVCATAQKVIAFRPPLKTTVNTGATLVFVSVAYVPNLVFHRDAFAWASRPLESDVDPQDFSSITDNISGLTLRIEKVRQNKQTVYSYDILGGANLIRPELAVKVAG